MYNLFVNCGHLTSMISIWNIVLNWHDMQASFCMNSQKMWTSGILPLLWYISFFFVPHSWNNLRFYLDTGNWIVDTVNWLETLQCLFYWNLIFAVNPLFFESNPPAMPFVILHISLDTLFHFCPVNHSFCSETNGHVEIFLLQRCSNFLLII